VTAAAPARTVGVTPARIALLWLVAAAISGFTLRRFLGPLDEGILMQAATRMADGQWPWRDFGWSYGPGQPLVVMALGKLFDPSLLGWRFLRVAADATAAVLVYALVREHRPRWALPAWAAAAVTAAQPTSANPIAPALALSLAAVLFATRGRPGWAGAMAAAAAFWRPDVGAIAALAAVATLLAAPRARPRPEGAGGQGENRAARLAAGRDAARGKAAGRARRDEARGGESEATPGGAARGGDGGEASGARGRGGGEPGGGDPRGGDPGGGDPGGGGGPGGGGPGGGEPGGGGDPRGGDPRGAGDPHGGGAHGAVVCLAVAAAGLVALYAPFLVAAGPGRVWEALVVQASRDGEWWRLPFPDGFAGGDVKDFLSWLAPYAALVTLVLAARRRTLGLFILGVGAVVYYVSRADLEHAQGLLVVAAALAASIRPRVVGAVVLALLLAVGTASRASALLRPPDLQSFGSVRVPPDEAEALPQVVALVDGLVPPDEPIYVAPRRSDLVSFTNPLLHYLTDRPNVLHRDVLLQAKPDEQRRIVAALERVKPRAIVRWTAPESAKPEPNRRGRPSGSTALDDYIHGAYRLKARFGDYAVLVPR
jgi:hypothetical protein